MKNYIVMAVDGSKARFFTLKTQDNSEMESGPNLVEAGTRENDVARAPDHEVFANDKGRNKAPTGGEAHGYDDHRGDHNEVFLKRFAEQVVDAVHDTARKADVLVVAASSHMTGLLRSSLKRATLKNVEIREYPQDVTKLPPREIHAHLADANLLPERREPTQSTRFRQ